MYFINLRCVLFSIGVVISSHQSLNNNINDVQGVALKAHASGLGDFVGQADSGAKASVLNDPDFTSEDKQFMLSAPCSDDFTEFVKGMRENPSVTTYEQFKLQLESQSQKVIKDYAKWKQSWAKMNLHIVEGNDFRNVEGEAIREFIQPAYNMGEVLRKIHGDDSDIDEEKESTEGGGAASAKECGSSGSDFSKFDTHSPQFQQFTKEALTFLATEKRPEDLQEYFTSEARKRTELVKREDTFLPIRDVKSSYDFSRWAIEQQFGVGSSDEGGARTTNSGFLSPGSWENEAGTNPKIVFSMRDRGLTVQQEWAQRLHVDPTFWKTEVKEEDYESRCNKEDWIDSWRRENEPWKHRERGTAEAAHAKWIKNRYERRKFGSRAIFPIYGESTLVFDEYLVYGFRVEMIGKEGGTVHKDAFRDRFFLEREDNNSTPHRSVFYLTEKVVFERLLKNKPFLVPCKSVVLTHYPVEALKYDPVLAQMQRYLGKPSLFPRIDENGYVHVVHSEPIRYEPWAKSEIEGVADVSISVSGEPDSEYLAEYMATEGILSDDGTTDVAGENDVFNRFNRFLFIADSVHLFDRTLNEATGMYALDLPEKEATIDDETFNNLIALNQYGIIPEIRNHNAIVQEKKRKAEIERIERSEIERTAKYLKQERDIGVHLVTDKELSKFKFYCEKCRASSGGTFGCISHGWIDDVCGAEGGGMLSGTWNGLGFGGGSAAAAATEVTKKRKVVKCPNNAGDMDLAGSSKRGERMRRWNEQNFGARSAEERAKKMEEVLAAGIRILGNEGLES